MMLRRVSLLCGWGVARSCSSQRPMIFTHVWSRIVMVSVSPITVRSADGFFTHSVGITLALDLSRPWARWSSSCGSYSVLLGRRTCPDGRSLPPGPMVWPCDSAEVWAAALLCDSATAWLAARPWWVGPELPRAGSPVGALRLRSRLRLSAAAAGDQQHEHESERRNRVGRLDSQVCDMVHLLAGEGNERDSILLRSIHKWGGLAMGSPWIVG